MANKLRITWQSTVQVLKTKLKKLSNASILPINRNVSYKLRKYQNVEERVVPTKYRNVQSKIQRPSTATRCIEKDDKEEVKAVAFGQNYSKKVAQPLTAGALANFDRKHKRAVSVDGTKNAIDTEVMVDKNDFENN